MEDAAKLAFKGKFIRLVVLLNLDVLFFFLAAILYFLLRDRVPFGMVLSVLFLILGVIFGVIFMREYRKTRAWLEEHA